MAEVGPGEHSARRVLAVDSALLIVIVVAVYLSIVLRGGQGNFPLWALAIGFVAALITLVTGMVAWRVSDRTLRVLAFCAVGAYWATIVTFPIAVPAEGIDRIPWTLSASGAAAAAALVASGRGVAWATVVAGAAAGLGYRTLFGGLDLDGVVNDLQALLTGAVVCVIGGHILSMGRGLDVAAASTTEAAALESAEQGRLAARARAAAIVHDEVLATLTLAASDLPFPRERLAAQSREAVAMVTRLTDDQADERASLRMELATAARLHGASFTVRGEFAWTPPVATEDALLGATRQALRNSAQHAPDATRKVVLVHEKLGIRVEIVDDGAGFDVGAIPDDRLGIRQSIVGRMSRVDGGSAQVDSAIGNGTVIRLFAASSSVREFPTPDSRADLRLGVAVIAVVYVVIQIVCAILAAVAIPRSWPWQLVVLAAALLGAELLRRSPGRIPSRGRTATVLALTFSGLFVGSATVYFADGVSFAYGVMWFAVAFAFLLVTLALRGRMAVAVAGAVLLVVVLATTGVLGGASIAEVVQVAFRPAMLVGLAVALLVFGDRMQRRINGLHRDALSSAERASWTLAARVELAGRVVELARTAVPLLERIGEGSEATASQRREYASCEGELRDGLRAGSLASEPLTSVVAAARERGVDVLLLDDGEGAGGDAQTGAILRWMAEAMATANTRAVGRLLPPGRDSRATIIVDGRHAEFRSLSPAQPSVMSFHGE